MSRNLEFSDGEFYHIYSRGTEKRKIFLSVKDYERFLALIYLCNNTEVIHLSNYPKANLNDLFNLKRANQLVDIGAYCLMPNHFHILIKERKKGGISIFMHKLLTAYTMYFNKKNKRSGSLFQGAFKAIHVKNDNYLKYLFAYIHLNPIKLIDKDWKKKGITNFIKAKLFLKNYPYSSYLDYIEKGDRTVSKILNTDTFPYYFEFKGDFTKEMDEWLKFVNDSNVKASP